jgi:hypothetical protein
LSDFNENFIDRFSKNPQNSDFMKICPVVTELFHEDGRKVMTKLTVAFSILRTRLKVTLDDLWAKTWKRNAHNTKEKCQQLDIIVWLEVCAIYYARYDLETLGKFQDRRAYYARKLSNFLACSWNADVQPTVTVCGSKQDNQTATVMLISSLFSPPVVSLLETDPGIKVVRGINKRVITHSSGNPDFPQADISGSQIQLMS